MKVFWLEAQPWNYATSAAATVSACSEDLSAIVHFNGGEFLPVIDGGPIFVTEVFDGAFSGRADSARGEINLLAQFGDIDEWATYAWQGRPLQIYSADINTDQPSAPAFPTARTKIFDGLVESYDPDEATLHLVMRPPEGKVASQTYAGTGGAAGSTNLKGGVKPFSAGTHTNRPAKLIDATKLLFQVHGYGAIAALSFVRERGIKLDQPFTYHATSAALLAAVVPATQIHVCLAEGLFRLGFTPQGEITADFTGGVYNGAGANDLANVVQLLLSATGWDMTKIDQPSIDALYNATIVPVQFYDDSGIDIVTALSSLLSPAGAYWDVDELGIFYVGIFQIGTVADFSVGDEGVADFDMLEVDYLPTRAPFWKTRVGYAENPFTMTFADTEAAPSLFTWVAYANNITGTVGFTNGANTGQTHIGIASNQLTETESTDPAAYTWSLIRGADGATGATGAAGAQGNTGATGAAGAQGASLYTWIAYANNAIGTVGFTTGAWTNQTHIGISNNQASVTEGTDPAAYTWSLIQGSQGVPGTTGANGAPTYTWFAYANNATGTSGFTTGAWTNQTYLGLAANKTTDVESQTPADYSWSLIQGAQGAQGNTGAQGNAGAQGASLFTWIAYANNITGTVGFTNGANTGQTHIGISNNQASATEGTDPAAYTWSLIQGTAGVQGTQGPDGRPSYTWFAYADTADGSGPTFTTGLPGERIYLGIAANKTTDVESQTPTDYTWSLINLTAADQIRLDGMETGATAGADINTNVYDGGELVGGVRVRLPRGDLRTSIGISSGFTGERYFARRNFFQLGLQGADAGASGDRGSGLTEGGAEWSSNVLMRTPSGIASSVASQQRLATMERVRFGTGAGEGAIADENNAYWVGNVHAITTLGIASSVTGQQDWATYTGLSTGVVAGRVSRINNLGRISDPRMFNTQALVGPANTSNLVPQYTVNATDITVTLPGHNRNISGPSAPIAIFYGTMSFNVAFGAYWIAAVDDDGLVGSVAPIPLVTINPNDLLVPYRYHVASGYAPNSAGAGSTVSPGGGGGFAETCVSVGAFVAVADGDGMAWKLSPLVLPGVDFVRVLLEDGAGGWALCTGNYVTRAPSVRLILENGRPIDCARSTPITQPDTSTVFAGDSIGALAAFNDGDRVGWSVIAEVRDIGSISVSHLSCGGGTYLAGMIPGEGVFTHNPQKP